MAQIAQIISGLLAVILAVLASAVSADVITVAERPIWTTELTIPDNAPSGSDRVVRGREVLLRDTQTRVLENGFITYLREVTYIHDRVALEQAGTVQINYDPAFETITLNTLSVLRDGQTIDHTNLQFTELRRETGLAWGILDGHITLTANIPDLRPGDQLEMSYSRSYKNSVVASGFHTQFYRSAALSGAPVSMSRNRIIAPLGTELAMTQKPDRVGPVNTGTEYVWQGPIAPRTKGRRYYALWSDIHDPVQVSSPLSWRDVSAKIAPHYAPAADLPDELQSFVRETLARFPDTDRRVTEVLRLVQMRIRYVGIEIGDGGYIPRQPGLVWSRGYGDCKDKALLMVSLLEAMGIDASVALVDGFRGRWLERALPSPFVFDHAIVRVSDADGPYYLDPTKVLQGGVGRAIAIPDYGFALPLMDGGADIEPVPVFGRDAPEYDVHDTYDFSEGGDTAALLHVVTTYRGDEADKRRVEFKETSVSDTHKNHLGWYERRFGEAEPAVPMELADDMDANEIRLTASYRLTNHGFRDKGFWESFYLNPYAVRYQLDELDDIDEQPIVLPYEMYFDAHQRHTVTLTGLPDPLKPPADLTYEGEYVHFSRIGSRVQDGTEISVRFDLDVVDRVIAPGEGAAYEQDKQFIEENDNWRYNLRWRAPGAGYRDTALIGPISAGTAFGWVGGVIALGMVGIGVRQGLSAAT